MYRILIKYDDEHNLWKVYGTESTTTSASGTTSQFAEYGAEDLETLQEELVKLDAKYGHDSLKVIKDLTTTYTVDIKDESEEDEEMGQV